MRQPPPVVSAVFVFEWFARISVPGPSLVIVAESAIVEAIDAVTLASVVILAVVGPSVRVEPVRVYPVVLNRRDAADCGEMSVTVPAEPVKTASAVPGHETSAETPSNPLSISSQFPPPPRFAPVEVLLPAVEPSASQ